MVIEWHTGFLKFPRQLRFPRSICSERYISNTVKIRWFCYALTKQGAYILSAELPNKEAKLKNDVLPCPRLYNRFPAQTANIIWRHQHDCIRCSLGNLLKLYQN